MLSKLFISLIQSKTVKPQSYKRQVQKRIFFSLIIIKSVIPAQPRLLCSNTGGTDAANRCNNCLRKLAGKEQKLDLGKRKTIPTF